MDREHYLLHFLNILIDDHFISYKGETDIKVLNALQPDAYMVGNHEFDEGDKRLAELCDMANWTSHI